jgi:hypothetical protein
MLATGCWSCLVVCRSLTRGVTVFRVWRDDEYIARMLAMISRCGTANQWGDRFSDSVIGSWIGNA